MDKFVTTILDLQGRPVASANVSVFETGTAILAALYEDDETTPKSNPLTTDSLGLAQCRMANGQYDYQAAVNGVAGPRINGIELFDPDDAPPNLGGPGSSSDGAVAVFDGTSGDLLKQATGTGIAKLTSGVLSAGNLNLASEVTGTLPVANGGTGLTALGTAKQVLRVNSGATAAEFGNLPLTVNVQVFTGSGTYTPTAGMLYCIAECVGGGGGVGGCGSTTGSATSGAGAGGYARARLTAAQIGASKTVTIGAAGSGDSSNGNSGGSTSLGSLCVATGGAAAAGQNSTTTRNSFAGLGGIGTTGDILVPGGSGTLGIANTTDAAAGGGKGGDSKYGTGGCATDGTPSNLNARGYGGGGGGRVSQGSNANGGNGTAGICIVTEFIAA